MSPYEMRRVCRGDALQVQSPIATGRATFEETVQVGADEVPDGRYRREAFVLVRLDFCGAPVLVWPHQLERP